MMVLDVIQYRIIIHQLAGERENGEIKSWGFAWDDRTVCNALSKYKLQTMHEKEDED